jgi:hypothetical protein
LWNIRKKKEGIALMSYFRLLHLLVVNFYSIGVYIITDIYSPHGKTRTKIKVY